MPLFELFIAEMTGTSSVLLAFAAFRYATLFQTYHNKYEDNDDLNKITMKLVMWVLLPQPYYYPFLPTVSSSRQLNSPVR